MHTTVGPTLASAVWTAHLDSQSNTTQERSPKRRKVTSGHDSVDSALYGGINYGCICGVSAEIHSGAAELSHAFLISHLLSSPTTTATYIDSTQALDVRELQRGIATALQRLRGDDGDALSADALRVLDRLRIMRVFDFVGLTESIAEVRDILEGHGADKADSSLAQQGRSVPRGTVGDSQASENEDELLDEPSPPPPAAATSPNAATAGAEAALSRSRSNETASPPGLLLINNLPDLVAPLLKSNPTHGNALLTGFMRSLAHLARAHHLCTLVLNQGSAPQAKAHATRADDAPSAFASCTLRPMLGKGFAFGVDLHLLVHSMGRRGVRGVEKANVLEVVADRDAGRVGRWTSFQVAAVGGLVAIGK